MTATHMAVSRIRPSRGWIGLGLADVWHHRELVFFLTWRDIQLRYKQTMLGIAWVALQPLATMALYTVVFGMLVQVPSEGLPYAAFVMAGLVPWLFFSSAFSRGASSLVGNANLISKVYFPRLVVPIASVLSPVVDVMVALAVFVGLAAYFGITPAPMLLYVVPLLVLTLATALGVALWLSALNVRYRDVGNLQPFVTQVWFYATPIVYPMALVPPSIREWLGLNPLATIAEGMRWAVLGAPPPPARMVAMSLIVVAVLLVTGAYAFRRMEKTFADLL